MTPSNTTRQSLWRPRLISWSTKLAKILATKVVRILIILVGLSVASYLLYVQVWQIIQEEAPLPAGVPPTNPSLNTELLQNINDHRASRVKQVPFEFKGTVIFQADESKQ